MRIDAGVSTMRLNEMLGRIVVDANGKRLGRVVEIVAEPRGNDLCVTGLIVGVGGWVARLGANGGEGGHHVRWEKIAALEPRIMLHPHASSNGTKG